MHMHPKTFKMKTLLLRPIVRRLRYCIAAIALSCINVVAETSASRMEILSLEGTVEFTSVNTTTWQSARVGQIVQFGDRIRTSKRSRASVRFADLSVMRLNENTVFEILPPMEKDKKPLLDFKSGSVYFYSREKPSDVQFRTPTAIGAIRGTEFFLAADNKGETRLVVLDGEVELKNASGSANVQRGEEALVRDGSPPAKTALLNAINVIQWSLYYPAILDPAELRFGDSENHQLRDSVSAYRSGDLRAALMALPAHLSTDDEKIFSAAVELSVGDLHGATNLSLSSRPAEALRTMVAAVHGKTLSVTNASSLASEWMAESYYRQAHGDLEGARRAAREATKKSPSFGFAWARLAEMEFSFARRKEAETAVARALTLSPRNAQALSLKGFLAAARNDAVEALRWFNRAIEVDPALANAWLGKGLTLMRLGRLEEGRKTLQVAASLEPQRAVLRSYAAKSFSVTGRDDLAEKELRLAKDLDPNDPTAWLYSALLNQQRNQINRAIRDLERSQDLNDNRHVFRSGALLDQDRAVRSANLASIYRDVGMTDVSVREASKAVGYDYANYSAHLFLAGSYDAVRDPKLYNLRYEAAARDEWLVANLLAPVGGGTLSRNVSQQDYARLFERNRLGISSQTEYFDNGDWVQSASQYGAYGQVAYAVDTYYRSENGARPNNDLEQLQLSAQFKAQITPADTVFFQAEYFNQESGDIIQYHDQRSAVRTLRVKEEQLPNLFLGWHHEWSPESHTLFLASRLDDALAQGARGIEKAFVKYGNGSDQPPTSILPRPFNLGFRRAFEAYSLEAQQILQKEAHTFVAGARYQFGSADTEARLRQVAPGPGMTFEPIRSGSDTDMDRQSVYGYYHWQILRPLRLTAGLSYDRLRHPANVDTAPVTDDERTVSQLSPKAGLTYDLWSGATMRAMYGQSLGGFLHENSVQLEPTQIGGFNQTFRSIAPESAIGAVPGSRFEFAALGLDQKFSTGTYLAAEGQWLSSVGRRQVGAVTSTLPFIEPDEAFALRQRLTYDEKALQFTVNQLVAEEWAMGARYRIAEANLEGRYGGIRQDTPNFSQLRLRQDESAILQQLNLYVIYNHRCGFFGEWQSVWNHQSNAGYVPSIGGEDFWQHHAFVGYRFPRRHVELRVGVLNLTGEEYRLNPLNLYAELPRERTYTASVKINF